MRLLPYFGPGFLIFLERIDFHPAFENRHRIDPVPSIDQFLDEVGEARLAEAAGLMEARGLVPFLRTPVAILERLRSVFREHGHADEFTMHLLKRQMLADFPDMMVFVSHDES